MDKLPVGQLPDISQSSLDDEIMIITEADTSQLRKEKISNILTDIISVQENNALTKGTDGKMFVTDFGNASNITEGTLPVDVLPESGVTADTYAYPSSVTVNAQGQVTAIEEGTPSGANADTDLSNLTDEGEKHFLNKTQITNCMLEAPNGIATYSGTTVTVQAGTNYLFPNGRNSNNTLQNTNFTAASNITGTMSGSTAGTFVVFVTSELELIFANQSNYFITNTQPTALNDSTTAGVWFNPQTNLIYQCAATASTPSWSTFEGAICATLSYDGSTITAFNPTYPIELSNKLNITLDNVTLTTKETVNTWGNYDYTAGIVVPKNTPVTAETNGIVMGWAIGNIVITCTVNGVELPIEIGGNADNVAVPFSFKVGKNDEYKVSNYDYCYFYPCKGEVNA